MIDERVCPDCCIVRPLWEYQAFGFMASNCRRCWAKKGQRAPAKKRKLMARPAV